MLDTVCIHCSNILIYVDHTWFHRYKGPDSAAAYCGRPCPSQKSLLAAYQYSQEVGRQIELYQRNLALPVLVVNHKDLESFDESIYRKKCVRCEKGILLVTRDSATLSLEEFDVCRGCGQRYRYLDIKELRIREGDPS